MSLVCREVPDAEYVADGHARSPLKDICPLPRSRGHNLRPVPGLRAKCSPLPKTCLVAANRTVCGGVSSNVCWLFSPPPQEREEHLANMGLRILRENPRVCLLGDTGRKRLPIFSFVVRHGKR